MYMYSKLADAGDSQSVKWAKTSGPDQVLYPNLAQSAFSGVDVVLSDSDSGPDERSPLRRLGRTGSLLPLGRTQAPSGGGERAAKRSSTSSGSSGDDKKLRSISPSVAASEVGSPTPNPPPPNPQTPNPKPPNPQTLTLYPHSQPHRFKMP